MRLYLYAKCLNKKTNKPKNEKIKKNEKNEKNAQNVKNEINEKNEKNTKNANNAQNTKNANNAQNVKNANNAKNVKNANNAKNYVSPDEGIFKRRVLNPFQYQKDKKCIMKHVNSLSFLYNELKSNVEDLERTYDNFIKALEVSDETEKHLLKVNNERTNNFINTMEELKRDYDIFKDNIEEDLNRKKNDFNKTLNKKIKGFFRNSVKELKGISKYIKYINSNAYNLNKIVSSIFSKAMHLSEIYEQNIHHIYEIGKEYYRMKLNTLNNMLLSEYDEYNKQIKLISNEKYLDKFSDVFYMEMLKDYLQNCKDKFIMIDLSNFLERHSFLELSYFFNTIIKNYNKGIIIYVINRVDVNYYINKMIFIESNKLLEIVNFIKSNYSHLQIDYVTIHIFNIYISVFINANGILYHVNYEHLLDERLLSLYNTYNYGYFFTNQKINYEEYNLNDDYIYVLYVGSRSVEDNYFIYNREDMIEFKKLHAYKIIVNNNVKTQDSFFNIYLLKLESEYNFYNKFLSEQHAHRYRFSVHKCNIILTYDSLSKYNIPNEKFTPHFTDVYILIIIYPGKNVNELCSFFNNYLFSESIYNLRKEESNVLEIYSDMNKITLLVNNKAKNYYVNISNKKTSEPLEISLLKIQKCLKFYIRNNYIDYFDYLNIIYFISSD
ncbi:hypothetical protein, conserved [Plasmodium malariae]|uniref:Uncharacterized protein n=1 Tax=Plasmodium malariae TaxID=5858 RepID=A0A1A8WGI6_PLAMA|nr:hypothetical protein, conserved [Plasmodium malariae]